MSLSLHTIVIGAGQAGLVAGYYLQQQGIDYTILEALPRVGDQWRNRWKGLRLFTPNAYNALPGFAFSGKPYDLPDHTEVADYFEAYVDAHELKVRTNSAVTRLAKATNGLGFSVSLKDDTVLKAQHVIIAAGAYRTPIFPAFAKTLPPDLLTAHTSEIRDPKAWLSGHQHVLVVGAGASGKQLAQALQQYHTVTLAGRDPGHLPRLFLGRDVYDYLYGLHLIDRPVDSWLGKRLSGGSEKGVGEIRVGESVDVMAKRCGVIRKPRITKYEEDTFHFTDGTSTSDFTAVLFATGYKNSYPFIHIDNALDELGNPKHVSGHSPVQGLHWLGLPLMRRVNSALLGGVGKDAKEIVDSIV